MPHDGPHITPAELRVLKVLWSTGPRTVRQVKDALTKEDADEPAYTTVMTMMKQLADKGVLAVDRRRQTYVYSPAVRREDVLKERLVQFLHGVFDGRVEDMVLQLAEETDLSAEDLRRIEAKIQEREAQEKRSGKTAGRAARGNS